MFETPVLFLTFNRLDTTKQVFSVIRQIKPKHFYISSDGPRTDREGEKAKVEAVRRYVLDNIDWDCEIKTLFRDKNLGCGKAVSGAITWFFEQVEQGIILEDDTLPSTSFFSYCTELLERYKDDQRIYHIAGWSPLFTDLRKDRTLKGIKDSYYFGPYPHIWGWATWRRAWHKYNFDIQNLTDFVVSNKLKQIYPPKDLQEYWLQVFQGMQNHEIDTWDYQWSYVIMQNNGFCINPVRSLITNVGFNLDGTHTVDFTSSFANTKRYKLVCLQHPDEVSINKYLAILSMYAYIYGKPESILRKLYNKIRRLPLKIKKLYLNV
jgi:hypothetical protein